MKKLKKIFVLFSTIISLSLFAGTGHSHVVSDKKIKENSFLEINKLIEKKSLEKSWQKSQFVAMEKIKKNKKIEWRVSFKNINMKDKNKQTIYLFMSTYGKIRGANYTGK